MESSPGAGGADWRSAVCNASATRPRRRRLGPRGLHGRQRFRNTSMPSAVGRVVAHLIGHEILHRIGPPHRRRGDRQARECAGVGVARHAIAEVSIERAVRDCEHFRIGAVHRRQIEIPFRQRVLRPADPAGLGRGFCAFTRPARAGVIIALQRIGQCRWSDRERFARNSFHLSAQFRIDVDNFPARIVTGQQAVQRRQILIRIAHAPRGFVAVGVVDVIFAVGFLREIREVPVELDAAASSSDTPARAAIFHPVCTHVSASRDLRSWRSCRRYASLPERRRAFASSTHSPSS